ncbi:hypothetical protein HDV05_001646 [Chytridiales sp. JEL 0842]|nr:hypothetical protein HDV05_001646 [Chytridiales sp. JEL 0842]
MSNVLFNQPDDLQFASYTYTDPQQQQQPFQPLQSNPYAQPQAGGGYMPVGAQSSYSAGPQMQSMEPTISWSMSVLNPFKPIDQHIMDDADLAGPLIFCFLFGGFLLFNDECVGILPASDGIAEFVVDVASTEFDIVSNLGTLVHPFGISDVCDSAIYERATVAGGVPSGAFV